MRAAKLTIAPDARAALAALLGGDRLASRSELRKLALYSQGQKTIELADVMAVVADASALALDGVIDAAFAGETRAVETEFGKARAGGSSPAAIISAAIRQVANLHKMKLAVDGGDSIEFAMKRGAPPVHFSREKDGRRGAARLDGGAPAAGDGAARHRLARHAPQCRAGRGDRATDLAVDRGERAAKGDLAINERDALSLSAPLWERGRARSDTSRCTHRP